MNVEEVENEGEEGEEDDGGGGGAGRLLSGDGGPSELVDVGEGSSTSLTPARGSSSCPFAATIRPHNGQWQLRVLNPSHRGHEPDHHLLAAQAKVLSFEEKQLIRRLWSQDPQIKPARLLDFVNAKRKEAATPAMPNSKPISKHLASLRAKRGVKDEQGDGEGGQFLSEEEVDEGQRDGRKSDRGFSDLETRCARDFATALAAHGSLDTLPGDHDVRLNAAAQLYLATEPVNASVQVKSERANQACRNCKQPGHNRRSCPQLRGDVKAVSAQQVEPEE